MLVVVIERENLALKIHTYKSQGEKLRRRSREKKRDTTQWTFLCSAYNIIIQRSVYIQQYI